jgi:hypothetical protein
VLLPQAAAAPPLKEEVPELREAAQPHQAPTEGEPQEGRLEDAQLYQLSAAVHRTGPLWHRLEVEVDQEEGEDRQREPQAETHLPGAGGF